MLDGDPAPLPRNRAEPPSPIFGPFLLWPNCWMHQDATCYGGRPQPRQLRVRWGPSPLHKKGAEPPIFGPCLLWPNACMDEDATWYGGRPQQKGLCVTWEPSPPPKKEAEPGGGASQFSAHVYCGQTARWIKMALGMAAGLGPVHIVLDGDTAPLPKKGGRVHPQYSAHLYCGQTAGCIKMPLGMEIGLGSGDFVLDGDPALPSPKGGGATLPSFRLMSIVAKRLDGSRWHLACRWASVQAALW